MKIFFRIDDKSIHLKYEFHGEYALESMILSVIEIFYGSRIKNSIKEILNSKLSDEEHEKNLKEISENIHKIQTGRF